MDLRGNPCDLKGGDWVTTGNCPRWTGLGVCERLLEAIRVDPIDNPIGETHWLSPVVRPSE